MAVPRLRQAAVAGLFALASACVEAPTWTPPEGEARSLGAELYVVLCDRIAASELPEDVRAHRSNALCHHDEPPGSDTPARLVALYEQRTRLVSALDAAFTRNRLDDELGAFLTKLLPFYEPPAELLPEVTRAFADAVSTLAIDEQALAAFQRLSARRGYRPHAHAMGMLGALFKYPELDAFLRALLGAIDEQGPAHAAFAELSSALSLEFATFLPRPESEAESTLDVLDGLFFRPVTLTNARAPRFLARRDARGLVLPSTLCSGDACMFEDVDGDGAADMDPVLGGFRALSAPTPFPVLDLPDDLTKRDDEGRPEHTGSDRLVYEYTDVHRTFAGALAQQLPELALAHEGGPSALLELVDGLDVLLGPRIERPAPYGKTELVHHTHDAQRAVALDWVQLFQVLGRSPDIVPFLTVLDRLVREHEPALAAFTKALLDAKALADASSAKLSGESELWDDAIEWFELMSRTSRLPGQETMLEGVLRAAVEPGATHFGDIVAIMLRHRDRLHFDPRDANAPPQGQFITPVDRTRPDTVDNRSIMQRSLHLVGEVNAQTGVCNRQLLLIQPCQVLDYDDLGRLFGGSATEEWKLELGLGLNQVIDALNLVRGIIVPTGGTLSDVTGIKGLDDYPDPRALVRLLFTDNAVVDLLVDPLLVRNAPNASEQYWLKKVYADTIEAWEVPLHFDDGSTVSFWQAIYPLAKAFNRHDYDPRDAEHVGDEHSYYLYIELASSLGRHYGSPAGGHASHQDAPFFSLQADARAYEGLLADMLAGPGLLPTPCSASEKANDRCYVREETLAAFPKNLGLFERMHHVLGALDAIQLEDGRDGIDVVSSILELLLNPHKACAPGEPGLVGPDGLGACDRADAPYPPLVVRRSDDELFLATNLGIRYDGTLQGRSASWDNVIQDQAGRPMVEGGRPHLKGLHKRGPGGATVPYRPRRYASPIKLLLHTLRDVDDTFSSPDLAQGAARHARFRHARSTLVDQFLTSDGKTFTNRATQALMLALFDFAKERIEHHRSLGDFDAWLGGLLPRSEAFAQTPLLSSVLEFLRAADQHAALQRELPRFVAYLFDGERSEASLDSTLYALLDFVQVLRDDRNMQPALAGLSRLIAPNAPEAVKSGEPLSLDRGALRRVTALMHEILPVDEAGALVALLENLVTPQKNGETPLEALVDVVAEVNRARPSSERGKQMRARDFEAVFGQLTDFMSDERRGLERIYDLVQQRAGPSASGDTP